MSNNNQPSPEVMGLSIMAACMLFAFYFMFALLAFGALVFTILAFLAWHKPLKLGKDTIYPHEARAFVGRGIGGAILLPVFAAFCELLFQTTLNEDVWVYLVIGGYAAGSIGIELLRAQEETEKAQDPEYLPPMIAAEPVQTKQLPALPRDHRAADDVEDADASPAEATPFRFADWNDDEELK